MAVKSNKSFAKRLKISKNGKIKARVPGQNHYNAKENSSTQTKKGRMVDFKMSNKDKRRFLAHL